MEDPGPRRNASCGIPIIYRRVFPHPACDARAKWGAARRAIGYTSLDPRQSCCLRAAGIEGIGDLTNSL